MAGTVNTITGEFRATHYISGSIKHSISAIAYLPSWSALYYILKSGDTWYRRETNTAGGYFILWFSPDAGVTWEELLNLDITESDPVIDLIHQYRHRIVDDEYHVDQTLTATGYAGTEGVDWENLAVYGQSWSSYWTRRFDFFYIGGLTGDTLKDITSNGYNITITGKDFTGDYIPATSTATFQAPDNATLKSDDTDYLWFDRNGVVRNVEVSELVDYDFARTVVKYDNSAPYHIRFIGILKVGETLDATELTKLYDDFELSQYWSGVLDVRGVVKDNRGLAQSVWPVISTDALNYTDTYVAAVVADGGEIIDLKTVQSEYQRLIDTGNIDSCWYAYHYKAGVKKSIVNYGGTDYDVVAKWYNMSPVVGRFGIDAGYISDVNGDTRPEYTSSGLLFRNPNLDTKARCGLMSVAASVLTNNNNIVRQRAIVASLGASTISAKGTASDDGIISLLDYSASRKLGVGYRVTGTSRIVESTPAVFVDGVETEIEADFLFDGVDSTMDMEVNGVAVADGGFAGTSPIYPQMSYIDCIGCSRSAGREPFKGYIKQIELYTL